MSSLGFLDLKDSATNKLACIQENLKWITAELRKKPFIIEKKNPKMNERLETFCEKVMPSCIHQVAELERQYNAKHKDMLLMEEELKITKSELKQLQENEIKRTEEITKGGMDLVHKIHGHKDKDEGDPEKPAAKYSKLFKSTFEPLYSTLEETTFNFNEDESSFVVNNMLQITYKECTELMISKMSEQLLKLFVQQRELSDIEKERMTDTQYAYGLLLHAANIQEYRMSDDIDKIMTLLCKNELFNSVSVKMGEQLESLIERAMEVIQSLLILVPPLVVDCSPHPDIDSGAYPGKKVAGFTLADYVTTQSALFYSYREEAVARHGDFSSMSYITLPRKLISTRVYRTEEQNAIPTRSVIYSQKQEVTSPELLQIKQELQPLVAEIQEMKHVVLLSSDGYQKKSDEQYQQIKRQQQQLQEFHKREVQQLQDSIGSHQQQLEERQHQLLQESDDRQNQQLQDFNERQAQQLQVSTNRQLKQLEMSHERHQQQLQESNERQRQQLQDFNERQQQQLQESHERQQQQLQESNERQQQQLQELHVLIEGVRQDNQQLHEITRRNQEMETTIQRQDEEIDHLRSQIETPQWVIEGDEIQMTEEVIGIGGWGEVKVGVFRGTRVAVKCLHQLILSQFNLALFSREMDIASRIRHPNLLQFIGATRVGNPMILAELMPTSLREEMTIKPLTRPQILSISRDVASALNYLHLRRPEAILHRDVASPNVLLEPLCNDRWKAKLSDYGSANLQHKISSTVGPGNPAYAAPESRYPNDHSPAMDVYSFGVLLLEMVVHQPPPPTTREKVDLIMTIQWPRMKTIIQSCTKEDKNERPITSTVLQRLHHDL